MSAWRTSQSPSRATGEAPLDPGDVVGRQAGDVRVDAAVELPDVVERGAVGMPARARTGGRRGSAPRGSRAGSAPRRRSRSRGRRTRSIVPMPSGPRSARSPRSQRRASAPVHASPRRGDRRHGAGGRARRDARGRRPRRTRSGRRSVGGGSVCGAVARIPRAARDDAAELADELEGLAVLDEPLERGELGFQPVARRPATALMSSIFGCFARRDGLVVADELLVQLLARRGADELDRDLGPQSLPDSRIIFSARSTMRTGSPMSRTYT